MLPVRRLTLSIPMTYEYSIKPEKKPKKLSTPSTHPSKTNFLKNRKLTENKPVKLTKMWLKGADHLKNNGERLLKNKSNISKET